MNLQPIILASSSPRRREMLTWLGLPFSIQPADIEEQQQPGEECTAYVNRLAGEKAEVVARTHQDNIVLAADTIVELDRTLLGKPADVHDAYRILKALRGRTHLVVTAIALMQHRSDWYARDMCRTQVRMRNYSDSEMSAYIASGDALDKAGAYAIQHAGFNPVEGFQGCMASVMGLPMCHLARVLNGVGVKLAVEPVKVCRQKLRYDCLIHARVLAGEEIG